MEIAESARRHDVDDLDILHCLHNATREVGQGDRLLLLGPARDGTVMEIVVLDPEGDPVIIHAMKPLRPKFWAYL